jgi:hypothetical protein
MKVIKVESIKILLGGREIDLTPDEARRLQAELDNVLGVPAPRQWILPTYIPCVTPTITRPNDVGPWRWWDSPTCTGTWIGTGTLSNGDTTVSANAVSH